MAKTIGAAGITCELAETTGVVVAESLGISKGLQDGVSLQDLVLQLVDGADGASAADRRQKPHDVLAALSLSSARLTAHDDGLGLLTSPHALVRPVRNGVDVRGLLAEGLAKVLLDGLIPVKRELLVRVHGDEDEGGVGVDLSLLVADLDVVEQVGVVQVHELGVVTHAVHGRRVHGEHHRLGQRLGLILVVKHNDLALLLVDLLDSA